MSNINISQQFINRGFVDRVKLLSEESTTVYRQHLEEFINTHAEDDRFGDWTYSKSHLVLAWVAQLAAEPAILDVVQAVIGPDIILWNSFIPIKPPHSAAYFGWHQDGTFWNIAPIEETVTVWLALSNVTLANGGMRMIPGSHQWGQLEHEKTYDAKSMLRRGQRITAVIDETAATSISLALGEASLHNAMVLHGSGANESDHWRLAVGLNYVSGSVAPRQGYRDSGLLLRGEKRVRGFEAEIAAEIDLGERELEEYARAIERSAKRYEDV